MSEWQETMLYNIAEIQTGPFGSQLHNRDYVEYGTPIVTVEHLGNRKMTRQNLPYVSDKDKLRLIKYSLKYGDVVFSRVGSVDRCSFVSKEEDGWLFSGRCLRVRPIVNKIDRNFLYYYFSTEMTKETVRRIAVGATMPSINTELLSNLIICFPPLHEQRTIAEVLFSLDDKIDLLTRQNATLEALAQTYFQQWFVEDNENELISVSLIATLENISVNPARQSLEQFYHYSIPAYDNNQTPIVELGKTILSNKFIVQPNSILVSKLNPATSRIWRIDRNVLQKSVCSTEFQVLKPQDMKYYLFLYCLMKSNDVTTSFTMSASGTSGSHQRIRPEYILEIETPKPDIEKLSLFNKVCTPMMEKVKTNTKHIQTVQKLRDTLLPKLISGEVRVK